MVVGAHVITSLTRSAGQHGVHADPAKSAPQKPRDKRDWRLDSQRSGAEMGDSRSGKCPEWGIAPSPDLTAKLAFIVALGFVRFAGESTFLQSPAYPALSLRGCPVQRGIPAKSAGTMSFTPIRGLTPCGAQVGKDVSASRWAARINSSHIQNERR